MQSLAGNAVEIGGEVLIRDKKRMVFCFSPGQLASPAWSVVHFQPGNTDVGRTGRDDSFERVTPTLHRLVREAGNQIEVDVGNSRSAQAGDIGKGYFTRVKTPHSGRFSVNKRL